MTSIKNVQIRGDTEYQEIVGFGGAFTEATAYHFFKLPPLLQRKFLDLYFGENGIKFSLGRIHINSCDFSLGSYNFDEVPDDYTLKYFDDNVTHDTLEIIPLLREAMAASELNIRLVASPWSPPAWMKTPSPSTGKSSMLGSVTPNGLRNEARVKYAWAKYISRFVSAYKAKGVDIWAVTPQNEPEFPAPWEACSYNASFESDFINHFLGPILRHEHPHLKLLAFDHNKDHLEAWTKEILGKDKHNYVDGMAFHWYGGEDRMTDGTYGYEAVKATYEMAPNKLLLSTEGCSCPGVWLNNWLRAERLGHDILYDLMNYAQGWIDWNLLLDETGGPNHLGNNCDASLLAMDGHSRLHIQPKYYYMAHFSKFVLPGAKRVATTAVGDFGYEMMDPNIQPNIEIALYPCEKSTRQMWILNTMPPAAGIDASTDGTGGRNQTTEPTPKVQEASNLRLYASVNTGEARDGGVQRLCVGYGEEFNRAFLRLADCSAPQAALLHLRVRPVVVPRGSNDSASNGQQWLQLEDGDSGHCITATQSVAGALFKLQPCEFPVQSTTSTTSANTATATATTTPPTAQTVHPAYQNRGNLLSLLTYQHQVFQYDESTHEITLPAAAVIASLRDSTTTTTTNSDHANGPATATPVESTESSPMQQMCLTAGWPFFNAVAFAVPADFQDAVDRTKFAHHKSTSGASSSAANPAASTTSPEPESTRNGTATSMRTVIVAMNEATVDLPITLHDQKRRADFVYSMSPRSIQTIVYKN
eukprot:gene14198-10144_t